MYTAFFIGSGAVKRAWNPVIRALLPYINRASLTNDGANALLANIVYHARFAYSTGTEEYRTQAYKVLSNIRHDIAEEIRISLDNKELQIQDEFLDIFHRTVLAENKQFILISTNWDTIVDEQLNSLIQKPVLHLHGVYSEPQKLYLPTEICYEPYRTEEEKKEFWENHANIMRYLMDCDKIVIYGLSLSALDAELLQVFSMAESSNKLRKIIIIDKQPDLVCEKINIMLNRSSKIQVIPYTPDKVNTIGKP